MISITGRGRQRRKWRRMGLVAAVLAVAAPLATACGGGPHAGSGASPSQGRAQQLDAFAQCLRDNGEPNAYISKPNSNSNTSASVLSVMGYTLTGVTPGTAQFASAMKACKHLLPGGGPHPLTQQQKTQMLGFAACMRAHGYPAYPDPVFQNGGTITPPLPSSIDTASPQFEAALKACNKTP
jgi:hypothetical protein